MNFSASLPWTDKKGRTHALRSVIFGLLLLPGLVLAVRWGVWGLGTRPLKVAIHSTGYWAVWLLLGSLVVTPMKALTGNIQWPVVRRMVGVAALAYALIHLLLYMIDENWLLLHIGAEIVSRFYLAIGALALLGLVVLGITSTDAMVRRLGARWKQLHRVVYAIAVLTAVHYVLQSKADVSQALIAVGVFTWLMLWRRLPAGRDRTVLPLLALAPAAALVTLAAEFLWYRFGTNIDVWKVTRLEADVQYGLHPAALVLAVGLLVAGAVELWRLAKTDLGGTAAFTVLIYAAGAFVDDLGTAGQRRLLDLLWACAALYPLLALQTEDHSLLVAAAAFVVIGTLVASGRAWPISRTAAVLLLPLGAWIAYEATVAVA